MGVGGVAAPPHVTCSPASWRHPPLGLLPELSPRTRRLLAVREVGGDYQMRLVLGLERRRGQGRQPR